MRMKTFVWILAAFVAVLVYAGCGGGGGSSSDPVPVNANVLGTLTLPEEVNDPTYQVYIDDDDDPTTFVARSEGICACRKEIDYFFNDVPQGTYYIYGIVRMNGHLDGPPQSSDFMGFFGTPDGLKPAEPNLVVPAKGDVAAGVNITLFKVL